MQFLLQNQCHVLLLCWLCGFTLFPQYLPFSLLVKTFWLLSFLLLICPSNIHTVFICLFYQACTGILQTTVHGNSFSTTGQIPVGLSAGCSIFHSEMLMSYIQIFGIELQKTNFTDAHTGDRLSWCLAIIWRWLLFSFLLPLSTCQWIHLNSSWSLVCETSQLVQSKIWMVLLFSAF